MIIEAVTNITYDQYHKFCIFSVFKRKSQRKLIIPLLGLIAFLFVSLLCLGIIENNKTHIIAATIIIFCSLLIIFLLPFLLKLVYKSDKCIFKAPINYTFIENKFTVETKKLNSIAEYSYDDINELYETAAMFYLFITIGKIYIIPKDSFVIGNATDFRNLMKSQIGEKFKEVID